MSIKEGGKSVGKTVEEESRNAIDEAIQVPKGEFSRTFSELCDEKGFGGLITLQFWPSRPPPTEEMFSSKPTSVTSLQTRISTTQTSDEVSLIYTSPKATVSSPILHVQLENPEDGDSIIQLVIRNWKVDDRMFQVLQGSCQHLEKLRIIRFWNVGIKLSTIPLVVTYLESISNLSHLHLDNNPLEGEDYRPLLQEPLRLKNLSLRFSEVSDKGAEIIGSTLSNIHQSNKHLLGLNLTGNFITDKGAASLAQGLRLNRSLLSLCLIGNKISDAGAEAFASVMRSSDLTTDELRHRRSLILKSIFEYSIYDVRSTKEEIIASLKEGSPKEGSLKEGNAKKDRKKSGEIETKKDISIKSTPNSITPQKSLSLEIVTDPSSVEYLLLNSVQMDKVTRRHQFGGNFTLASLNLSKNDIGEKGVEALLRAVIYQQDSDNVFLNEGQGIMRIVLKENKIKEDNEVYMELKEKLKMVNPFEIHKNIYIQKSMENSS